MTLLDQKLSNLISDISWQLQKRRAVFLVKTNDTFVNEFLISKLKNINWIDHLIQDKDVQTAENKTSGNTDSKPVRFREFSNKQALTDQYLLDPFTQKEKSEATIFIIPSHFIHQILAFEAKEAVFSSAIFMSVYIEELAPTIFETHLVNDTQIKLNAQASTYLIDKVRNNQVSLGKLFYAIQFLKENTLHPGHADIELQRLEFDLRSILDQKGSALLKHLSNKISVEIIEAFFRSLVYVEENKVITRELDLQALFDFNQAPKEQIEYILESATAQPHQILIQNQHGYTFTISEFLEEWKDLKTWIKREKAAHHQYEYFESLALAYFNESGSLLNKDQIETALTLKEEFSSIYNWDKKYGYDKEMISSFILLSQNSLEETLKMQQKKRAQLLKNSVRISVAVSIAFLLSSFTALIAYLERNSAVVQQELALQAKEEAESARKTAELERLLAIEARKNESTAYKKAEAERLIALNAKNQAETERKNAVASLELAEISEAKASQAKGIAEKNEVLANEAKETAQLNFEISERLRNQQEARVTALEALGLFANQSFQEGLILAREAYFKNSHNKGFPLQSDIFHALLYAKINSSIEELNFSLDQPAKFLALSPDKKVLAVYTINGEISIYQTKPSVRHIKVINSGYIQNLAFLNDAEVVYQTLKNEVFTAHLNESSLILPLANRKYRTTAFWSVSNHYPLTKDHIFQKHEGFKISNEKNADPYILTNSVEKPSVWVEGKVLFQNKASDDKKEILFEASSNIVSLAWSQIHNRWFLGLENGQIVSMNPTQENKTESFAIHRSKVSHLKIIPYSHQTELMLSTGYDGNITLYVFDSHIPISSSISSRVELQGHRSWITGCVIDEEDKIAYTVSNDRNLKIWPFQIEQLLEQ